LIAGVAATHGDVYVDHLPGLHLYPWLVQTTLTFTCRRTLPRRCLLAKYKQQIDLDDWLGQWLIQLKSHFLIQCLHFWLLAPIILLRSWNLFASQRANQADACNPATHLQRGLAQDWLCNLGA
jgi:hypothetical protein